MYFLTDALIEHVISTFRDIEIRGPESGDWFFETFGPGNTINYSDKPYERFSDYENLLSLLHCSNSDKYRQIHKGTPFYYLSWTAFDMGNYEKALFYMDSAISEDIRKDPGGWINNPAGRFLTLGPPAVQAAARVAPALNIAVGTQIARFNGISTRPPLSVDDFVDRFVRSLVADPPKRSIITAFYTFLLEFEDLSRCLELRSTQGGSIEPFLTHLFKGGLIFESLLKHLYPQKDNGQPVKTLGDIFQTTNFRNEFLINVQTSAASLEDVLAVAQQKSVQVAFDTASRIRNTAGHNLVWNDVFTMVNYRTLFEQQVDALLYIVATRFI